jgi:uncharacterized DUF497 family protein
MQQVRICCADLDSALHDCLIQRFFPTRGRGPITHREVAQRSHRLPHARETRHRIWYNCYTRASMRFHFDLRKSERLRANPKRGIGFEEVQEVFSHPYYQDQRSGLPEQYRAIGWVSKRLYTVIFEVREDKAGEYYHLVTLWKATRQEQQLYDEHS